MAMRRAGWWAMLGMVAALGGAVQGWWQWHEAAGPAEGEALSAGQLQEGAAQGGGAVSAGHDPTGASQVLVALATHAASKPKVAVRTATQLRAQTREAPLVVDAQLRGKRIQVQGVLFSVESGAEGVWVLMLQAGDDGRTLRMVMAPDQGGTLVSKAPGAVVSVDCFDQGLIMGELMLADCRLEG
ncbi:hypothetical protein [Aquabacterium sp.]|uniref:hypothetical protein n=1 Tax=Aquabacterium sp. TaxID=1872578 RepID=UPI0035AFBE5A